MSKDSWRSVTPDQDPREPASGASNALLAASVWVLLGVTEALVRVRPVEEVREALARLAAPLRPLAQRASPARLSSLVAWASNHHLRAMTCLRSALCLEALLRAAGRAPELRLGVRRGSNRLEAHAWVELDAVALGEGGLVATFQPLEKAV